MPAFIVPSNLAFDNYNDLVTAIEDWMDRSDLSGSVQQMIALAEVRMRRELSGHMGENSASVVTTDGLGVLPDDFGRLVRVMYNGYTLPQHGVTDAPNVGTGTAPKGFTLERGGIRLWPEGNYTVTVLYNPVIPFLSEGNPTNDLLANHPDIYFFGAMMFAEGYLANDSRAATFKGLFDEALEEAKKWFIAQKFGGPLVPRVAFVP